MSGSGSDIRLPAPRRVRNGVRFRARETFVPRTWVAQQWLACIERVFGVDVLTDGLRDARAGQTVRLDIRLGRVEAVVQGIEAKPYTVELGWPTLTDDAWARVVQAMATEAVYSARLPSGDLPVSIEELFVAEGVTAVPSDESALRTTCGCDEERPCRHAATVAWLTAERLDADPLLVLTLHGMLAEGVLSRLRQARAVTTRGVVAAHADPLAGGADIEAPALEASVDEFWGSPQQLASLRDAPRCEHAPHALLRRLGPSPLNGRFPLVGLLASIYDTVTDAAVRIWDQAEGRSNGE